MLADSLDGRDTQQRLPRVKVEHLRVVALPHPGGPGQGQGQAATVLREGRVAWPPFRWAEVDQRSHPARGQVEATDALDGSHDQLLAVGAEDNRVRLSLLPGEFAQDATGGRLGDVDDPGRFAGRG